MADLLPTQSFLTVLGPIKVEFVQFIGTVTLSTGGTQTGVTDADTFASKMVAPKFVIVVSGDDASNTAWAPTISGKTITMVNTGAANVAVNCIVIGF